MTADKEAAVRMDQHRVAFAGMPVYEQAISEKLTAPLHRFA